LSLAPEGSLRTEYVFEDEGVLRMPGHFGAIIGTQWQSLMWIQTDPLPNTFVRDTALSSHCLKRAGEAYRLAVKLLPP